MKKRAAKPRPEAPCTCPRCLIRQGKGQTFESEISRRIIQWLESGGAEIPTDVASGIPTTWAQDVVFASLAIRAALQAGLMPDAQDGPALVQMEALQLAAFSGFRTGVIFETLRRSEQAKETIQ